MSDLIFTTYNDLYAARSIGRSLQQPTVHFVRVLRLLEVGARLALLRDAFTFAKRLYNGYFSIEQFVAFALFAWDPLRSETSRERGLHVSTPVSVRLNALSEDERFVIGGVMSGEDLGRLADVLLSRPSSDAGEAQSEILQSISHSLKGRIDDAGLGAAISQCLLFNSRLIQSYRTETAELVGFAHTIPEDDFTTYANELSEIDRPWFELPPAADVEFNRPEFLGLTDEVASIVSEDTLSDASEFNSELSHDLALAEKFGFVKTDAGLFVPTHARKQITADFSDLITSASADRSHLLALSPRAFEKFMADLFSAMGYTVELTNQSRDGGVDLICLRSMHGLPFRIAVELKRYREDRPISVQMVRSFVGANEQFGADKLVFVTTSSYTSPAMDYADRYASRLLHLKDYEQIKEWCAEARQQPWLLLPNSGTRLR
jgi:hypothetical protein